MLKREPGAGAAEPGLDLVEDQQNAVRVAQPTDAREPARRWHDDARLTLNGLDEDCNRPRRDGPLQSPKITEGNGAEARRERPKSVPILWFRRKADDGRRSAVEI